VFYDGQGARLAEEGLVGAILSLALLVTAVGFPGAFS
jgi:hypothetical protein